MWQISSKKYNGHLKKQVPRCIIESESESDAWSDLPSEYFLFEIVSNFAGMDAISFYYDYLNTTVP